MSDYFTHSETVKSQVFEGPFTSQTQARTIPTDLAVNLSFSDSYSKKAILMTPQCVAALALFFTLGGTSSALCPRHHPPNRPASTWWGLVYRVSLLNIQPGNSKSTFRVYSWWRPSILAPLPFPGAVTSPLTTRYILDQGYMRCQFFYLSSIVRSQDYAPSGE